MSYEYYIIRTDEGTMYTYRKYYIDYDKDRMYQPMREFFTGLKCEIKESIYSEEKITYLYFPDKGASIKIDDLRPLSWPNNSEYQMVDMSKIRLVDAPQFKEALEDKLPRRDKIAHKIETELTRRGQIAKEEYLRKKEKERLEKEKKEREERETEKFLESYMRKR